MASIAEVGAMRRALHLAADPRVPLGPNPRVGCVLLTADGTVVGEGRHLGAGTAHAEVAALLQAGEAARGATAVVTLEPCDHTGRTGPCTHALLAAGVSRVVFAQADTSPGAGGGAGRLRAAGVDVESGVLAARAARLNPEWTFALTHGRPHVTWKFAASLDGRAAAADGTSRWITSGPAREDVHAWRARCDAVVVGTGTVLADDPRLTVRDADDQPLPADRQPLRVVVGRTVLPPQARVLADDAPTLLVPTRDPAQVLTALVGRGRSQVWLEGGPRLAGAFVAAGLVDRVVAYYAGLLLGAGPPVLGPAGVGTLAQGPRLRVSDVTTLGPDVRVVAQRDEGTDAHVVDDEED